MDEGEFNPYQGARCLSEKPINETKNGIVYDGLNIVWFDKYATKADRSATPIPPEHESLLADVQNHGPQVRLAEATPELLTKLMGYIDESILSRRFDLSSKYNARLGSTFKDHKIVYHIFAELSEEDMRLFLEKWAQLREDEIVLPRWVSTKLDYLLETGSLMALNYTGWGEGVRPFRHFKSTRDSGAQCIQRSLDIIKELFGTEAEIKLRVCACIPNQFDEPSTLETLESRMIAESIVARILESSVSRGGDNISPAGPSRILLARQYILGYCDMTAEEFLQLPLDVRRSMLEEGMRRGSSFPFTPSAGTIRALEQAQSIKELSDLLRKADKDVKKVASSLPTEKESEALPKPPPEVIDLTHSQTTTSAMPAVAAWTHLSQISTKPKPSTRPKAKRVRKAQEIQQKLPYNVSKPRSLIEKRMQKSQYHNQPFLSE